MDRRPVSFFADGLLLDGDLWLPRPRRPGQRRPAVVACSGYQGLKDIHPERFARALVPAGYGCLVFDYRGFGRSEGERGRLVPQEQAEDVRAAVGFLEAAGEIDPRRIALVGWGLGGGVAVAAAAEDPRVAAVATVNAIGDGERSTRAMHDHDSWRALLERLGADRARRVRRGRSELVDPFEIVRLDPATRAYVEKELVKTAGFGTLVSLESADYLLRFRPETVVDRISPRPLLVVHGSENRLHLPTESDQLFGRAREPKVRVLLEGGGHTEWMYDDHPIFRRLVALLEDFLASSLHADKEAAS